MEQKGFIRHLRSVLFLAGFLFSVVFARAEDRSESFTIHLENYFVELQGGQRVDLDIHYQYAPNIARADIPDYRAVQILVEDALYGMPTSGPYWEITNREIVQRLLTAFPQFPRVESTFKIQPRFLLNIHRSSTVALQQADLGGVKLLTSIDKADYYQARDGHFNVLVPRPLKASLAELMQRVKNSADNAIDPQGVIFDIPCFPLAGSEYTFPAILDGLKPKGPYAAVVLPEKVGLANRLTKIANIGPLKGIIQIPSLNKTGRPVAEISLSDILGLENTDRLPLADAREKFFLGQATSIVMEEKYALPYKLRGDQIQPYVSDTQLALFATGKDIIVPKILVQP